MERDIRILMRITILSSLYVGGVAHAIAEGKLDAISKQDWSQPDVGVGVAESGRLDVRIWNPLVVKGTTTAQSASLV